MKTLTPTLLAAQKKPDRLPYVEAKVYDLEQGIKRLSWTRLYTGSEPDNHHGIAFDSQGSIHRIRAETLPLNWLASTAYALELLLNPQPTMGINMNALPQEHQEQQSQPGPLLMEIL